MWPALWIGLGIVAGLALTIAAFRVSRDRDPITGEQLFQLGIIFVGTGVALMTTIGAPGLAMLALGVIYMGIGATRRNPSDS
jgi:hypothetical protein